MRARARQGRGRLRRALREGYRQLAARRGSGAGRTIVALLALLAVHPGAPPSPARLPTGAGVPVGVERALHGPAVAPAPLPVAALGESRERAGPADGDGGSRNGDPTHRAAAAIRPPAPAPAHHAAPPYLARDAAARSGLLSSGRRAPPPVHL